MFTGLIEETGIIKNIQAFDGGMEYTISAKLIMSDLDIDHSISINGACQTVIRKDQNSFVVQSIKETLDKTTFSTLKVNDEVNLERAMRADTRLGGHFVQGHINGIATFSSMEQRGENYLLGFKLLDDLIKYCVKEGSITINGISLTISEQNEENIYVSIIPHTWNVTNINKLKINDSVNIEVDMFAKYIYEFMQRNINKA